MLNVVNGSSKEKNVTSSFQILNKLLSEAKGKGSTNLVKQLGTRVNNDVKVVKPKNPPKARFTTPRRKTWGKKTWVITRSKA
jgi:hypothetical protein